MHSPVLFFYFKLASHFGSRLDLINKATRAGTLVANVNHPEGLKLHLRLHPSRSLPRGAHCAADSSGSHFMKRRKQGRDKMSNTSQASSFQFLNKDAFSAILLVVEHSQAQGFSVLVRGPRAGRAASPTESIAPLQDSASQASFTPFSTTGTGRSDSGPLIE